MAIHAAIHSLLWQSDLQSHHVLTTATEHNSVLRTLADLQQRRGLRWTIVECDSLGQVSPNAINNALRDDTRLVIINHASNITGFMQDLDSIAGVVAQSKARLMVDAAQSLGYFSLQAEMLGIDLLVAPTHKGLCGMLGTAFVAASDRVLPQLRSPWIGGTGRSSIDFQGPFGWRESIESGNLNGPSIASLNAGLDFISQQNSRDFQEKTIRWLGTLIDQIRQYPHLRLVGYPSPQGRPDSLQTDRFQRIPVLSFYSQTLGSHEMSLLLDSALGIECRSGLHCAGAIHPYIGSHHDHGVLRMSFGHTTTESDIEAAIEGIRLLGQFAS
jgi:selenocysteine lyase/cysteine desulfurase